MVTAYKPDGISLSSVKLYLRKLRYEKKTENYDEKPSCSICPNLSDTRISGHVLHVGSLLFVPLLLGNHTAPSAAP